MIDRKTIATKIPLTTKNGVFWVYIPDPVMERAEGALPVLGQLYSLREKMNISAEVLIRDYKTFARQASVIHASFFEKTETGINKVSDTLYAKFENFIEHCFLNSKIITPELKEISFSDAESKMEEEEIERAKGSYVFFYALQRYHSDVETKTLLKDFVTSLSVTEFMKSLRT